MQRNAGAALQQVSEIREHAIQRYAALQDAWVYSVDQRGYGRVCRDVGAGAVKGEPRHGARDGFAALLLLLISTVLTAADDRETCGSCIICVYHCK
jgi:hypothetical protein